MRLDRDREVEAPAQLRAIRPGEVDWPRVDLGERAVDVADEAVGEGRLDLGGRLGEAGDRAVGAAVGVGRGKAQVRRLHRLDRRAEPDLPAVALPERRVAAVDLRDEQALAGRLIEHGDVRGDDRGIISLLTTRRGLVVRDRGDEPDLRDGSPVQAIADRRECPEIRKMPDADIAVQRKIADRAKHIVFAAGNGQIDVELAAHGLPGKIGYGHEAGAFGAAVEAVVRCAERDARRRLAGGQFEQRPVEQEAAAQASGGRAGLVGQPEIEEFR